MQPLKPGYLTTEFWLTVVAQVMPLLLVLHVMRAEDVQSLQGAAAVIVKSAGAMIASATVIYQYIQSRRELKVAAQQKG